VGAAPLPFPGGALPQCPEPPDQFAPPEWVRGANASDVLLGFFQSRELLRLSLERGEWAAPPIDVGFTFDDALLLPGTQRLVGMTSAWFKTNPNCTNGCYAWASVDLGSGSVTPPSEATILPIQETMPGSMFPAPSGDDVWFQGSMPDNAAFRCSTGWCNYRVSATSGALAETVAVQPPQVATHCYARNSGASPLAFAELLDPSCGGRPGEKDWGLARVDFSAGTHELISCIPTGTVVSGAPDISAFSDDGTLLAQASPWWFTDGPLHLLVITSSGALVLDSALAGLPALLHAGQNVSLISISAVGFIG
jgi:hypothetical protein